MNLIRWTQMKIFMFIDLDDFQQRKFDGNKSQSNNQKNRNNNNTTAIETTKITHV